MDLVVTIPAYNEEKTIAEVIKKIPRNIKGISKVKVLVIDDGSTDKTVSIAKKAGADKIVSHKQNLGLGITFRDAMDNALVMGADIIVNIDADNQYDPKEIPHLIRPILENKADIVLGSRFKGKIEEMPPIKRFGNKAFTFLVRRLSGLDISDSQTGFRALTRDAAMRINILSTYTYTQEMIIQAAYKNLKVVEVPCVFRKREGSSGLISTVFRYAKSGLAITSRTYRDYRPLKFFGSIGLTIFGIGSAFALFILQHFLRTGLVTPYIPLTILTAITLIVGFQLIIFAMLADMIGQQRRIQEEILYRVKKNGNGR